MEEFIFNKNLISKSLLVYLPFLLYLLIDKAFVKAFINGENGIILTTYFVGVLVFPCNYHSAQ